MLNILCALCLITTTFTIECMEIFTNVLKKNGNGNSHKNGNNNGNENGNNLNCSKKKKIRATRSLSSSNFPSSIINNGQQVKTSLTNNPTTTPPAEHPFNTAVRLNDQVRIKGFLDNPYFNPNIHHNGTGTALHISVKACKDSSNFSSLKMLIEEPRIDVTEVNKELQNAQNVLKIYRLQETTNLILKQKMSLWSSNLFKRGLIQITTDKICKCELQPLYEQNGFITNDDINKTIEIIKTEITKTEKAQNEDAEDRELPESLCLPEYATKNNNDFMIKLIWFILNKNQLQINSISTNSTPTIK